MFSGIRFVEHHVPTWLSTAFFGFDMVEQAAGVATVSTSTPFSAPASGGHGPCRQTPMRTAQFGVLGNTGRSAGRPDRASGACVGSSTRARTGGVQARWSCFLCLSRRCSRQRKAAVLLVPVWAAPITSRPVNTIWNGPAWMASWIRSPFRLRRASGSASDKLAE